jgi:hypothetical protein
VGEKPSWKLTPEEWRTQVITFVSGLASVLAGAAIVGIAIALGRWWSKGFAQGGYGYPVEVTVILIFLTLASTAILVASLKVKAETRDDGTNSKPPQWPWWVIVSFGFAAWFWVLVFVVLLAWIGVAAGVK